jgi:hypothetical protein
MWVPSFTQSFSYFTKKRAPVNAAQASSFAFAILLMSAHWFAYMFSFQFHQHLHTMIGIWMEKNPQVGKKQILLLH